MTNFGCVVTSLPPKCFCLLHNTCKVGGHSEETRPLVLLLSRTLHRSERGEDKLITFPLCVYLNIRQTWHAPTIIDLLRSNSSFPFQDFYESTVNFLDAHTQEFRCKVTLIMV
jgi:hypothetical protein